MLQKLHGYLRPVITGSKIIANNAVTAMGNISVTQNVNINKKIAADTVKADTVFDEKPPHY